jgi:hypothetical protein
MPCPTTLSTACRSSLWRRPRAPAGLAPSGCPTPSAASARQTHGAACAATPAGRSLPQHWLRREALHLGFVPMLLLAGANDSLDALNAARARCVPGAQRAGRRRCCVPRGSPVRNLPASEHRSFEVGLRATLRSSGPAMARHLGREAFTVHSASHGQGASPPRTGYVYIGHQSKGRHENDTRPS